MPQTTKKKKPATTKKKSTASAKKPAAPEKKPIRREVFGAILAVLGVLTFIGYFSGEAFLVSGVCAVVKGLIGFGYWVFPPMLLIAAWGLLLHHGKPVALRTTAALMVPVFTGAFADIFHPINLSKQTEIFKTLYESGKELSCGGVLGGLISYGLSSAITSVAAGILLFLLLLLLLLLVLVLFFLFLALVLALVLLLLLLLLLVLVLLVLFLLAHAERKVVAGLVVLRIVAQRHLVAFYCLGKLLMVLHDDTHVVETLGAAYLVGGLQVGRLGKLLHG